MSRLNDNQKILSFLGGGLILCVGAGAGIWWAKGLVEEQRVAIEAGQKRITAAEGKIGQIPKLEEDVIVLRENVDTYVKILPEQTDVHNFLRTTNKFVHQSGVTPKAFIDGKPGSHGKFDNYSYRIECTASLWEFLKFINLFENYERFVRIKSFTITGAAGKDTQSYMMAGKDVRHSISLVVDTFVYRGGNQNKNVVIPNYTSKREKLREDIIQGFHSIQLDRYEYQDSAGRRDVFLDPRPKLGGPGPSDNPESLQRKRVDEFRGVVGELLKLHARFKGDSVTYLEKARLEKTLRAELTRVEKEAREVDAKITHPGLQRTWNNDVIQPIRQIWRELGVDEDPGRSDTLTLEQVKNLHGAIRGMMRKGDLDAARKRYDEHSEMLKFAEGDPRYGVAKRIEVLKLTMDRALEFNELPLKIEGVIVNEAGKSGLLVNGEVLEEGDYVTDDLLLKSVAQERAEFVFKGFNVVKTW